MSFWEDKNPLHYIIGWIVDIITAISIAWFVIFALGTRIPITGQSMEPNLKQGDVCLLNRMSSHIAGIHRLDVVVFEKEDGKYNAKRVIGLPGETVQVVDGQLYINHKEVTLSENFHKVELAGTLEDPVTLKKDEYILLGDNRKNSEDSRFSGVGNVKKEQIRGKLWLRIYPLSRLRLL